jgi:hypothetical protein
LQIERLTNDGPHETEATKVVETSNSQGEDSASQDGHVERELMTGKVAGNPPKRSAKDHADREFQGNG